MMHTMTAHKRNWLTLVGRVLLGVLFLMAGFSKIEGFEGTIAFMSSAGLPESAALLWLVIAVEFLGGLALILGAGTRYAAIALILFTLLATYFFHLDLGDVNLLKNLAVVGGLLYVFSCGGGHYSLDCKMGCGCGSVTENDKE